MKLVIFGGRGHLGGILTTAFRASGHEVVVVSRSGEPGTVPWDGRRLGPWAEELDGADVVINLAGRSVDCRYTAKNLRQMMDSRVFSTRVVGQAIAQAQAPPPVWLQMSTATLYAHRFDAPNDEATGIIGGEEPDAPDYWRYSIDIAQAWERTLEEADTPRTRKVALRTAIVMSTAPGGVFSILSFLTRCGLGGSIAGGRQFVSWLHEDDFIRSVELLIERDDIDGVVNLAAPTPLPQRDFMATLRRCWRIGLGVPATKWMIEMAAVVKRTDAELLLKSRRVIPGRLLEAGFEFLHPEWQDAAAELVDRQRRERRSSSEAA
ncbi:MAG: DUF1731 domain-containing protein [Acidobacteriota bacterium]